MPFDHGDGDDGGGGGDHFHNEMAVNAIADAALTQIDINCSVNQVCVHCVRDTLIFKVAHYYIDALTTDPSTPGKLETVEALATDMENLTKALQKEIAKWKTPSTSN